MKRANRMRALILRVVPALLVLVSAILTTPLWKGNMGGTRRTCLEMPRAENEKCVLATLTDIYADIESRPLVQQKATASWYIGMRVEGERVSLEDLTEDAKNDAFVLTLLPSGGTQVTSLPRPVIRCHVCRGLYPELNSAKKNLVLTVYGTIENVDHGRFDLSDVILHLDETDNAYRAGPLR
jgi:hypothetical protein